MKSFINGCISRNLKNKNNHKFKGIQANYDEEIIINDENFNFIFEKEKYINIIFLSRLTFRKGVDLLIEIIPEICLLNENVRFIIGGDGPKKPLLENMIKSANLEMKVLLLGNLHHNEVRKVMNMGHIYLNTSLTEAFCIANVEAASCGLYVISGDIGGVSEVLPDDMITLVKPDKINIIKGILEVINKIDDIKQNINENYRNYNVLRNTYNADIVAKKTVIIYNIIFNINVSRFKNKKTTFILIFINCAIFKNLKIYLSLINIIYMENLIFY